MMPPIRIAILDSNTLTCLGLQQVVSDMLPMADIVVFNSVEELKQNGDGLAHVFVSSRIYFEHTQFFQEHHKRAIVLVNGDMAIKDVLTINVCQSVKSLVKDIMALRQRGHAAHAQGIDIIHGNSMPPILSPRETEVAVYLCKGYINKEIADRLQISLSTIVTHRKNIMEKLHARSLADIIIYCVSHGILSIEEL